MTDQRTQPSDEPEFYVGYLPMPRGAARFVRIAVPGALWIMAIAAAVLSRSQPDAGSGSWDDANLRTFTGVVVASPYPMLMADDRGDGKPGAMLLVEMGKFGGGQRAAPLDGTRATIAGYLLERDGRRMIELAPGTDAFPLPSGPAANTALPVRRLGEATLRGEIVDSKCFLGAMRPGEGKTHKECAALCIAGGIPPMLITRDERGDATYYLLTNADGGAIGSEVLPLVADPVEVQGQIEEFGGLLRLRVLAPITRL